MTTVAFDQDVGNVLLRYARMLVARGFVHGVIYPSRDATRWAPGGKRQA